jgi:energy-coupling factor transporter ATP-binding protein EcfA2
MYLGANGAGKSTLIKLLVQETEPDEGTGKYIYFSLFSILFILCISLFNPNPYPLTLAPLRLPSIPYPKMGSSIVAFS